MDKGYVYYCKEKPPQLGHVPALGLLFIESFPDRTYVSEIDRMAWGKLVYTRELTPDEIRIWELTMKPREGLK